MMESREVERFCIFERQGLGDGCWLRMQIVEHFVVALSSQANLSFSKMNISLTCLCTPAV